jgi:nitrite reductase (NO-forming)
MTRKINFSILGASALALVLGIASGTPTLAAEAQPASIVRAPTDMPPPIARDQPAIVKVELETIEKLARIADGATYRYWTFNGQVPGPMFRVRVGDTVVVTLKNAEDSAMFHNVDFHAVTGPGGGGRATMAEPGETKGFTFKALKPGLYVYHCATPVHAQHVANGMYGLILVEPARGLPKVDREFYIMQGEIYTEEAFGSQGELSASHQKLIDERPEFYVFNGAVDGLTTEKPLTAKVGETVRIYFGVGGPNKTSSFHVIGEIFDKVYNLGSLTSAASADVQTVTVAPGGSTVVDIKLEVPGTYLIVDHALSRLERGLLGFLKVDGPANPEIFNAVTKVTTVH